MGLLNPQMQQYMQQQRQQQFWSQIARMGQGILAATGRGADIGPALAQGIGSAAQGGQQQPGLLEMMQLQNAQGQMQDRQAERERKTKLGSQYQNMVTGGSGLDPATGIDWNAPRPGNPDLTKDMSSQLRGLLGIMSPEQGMGLLAQQALPKTPPAGFTGGPAGLEPIPGGPADIGYLGRKAEATRTPVKPTERQQQIKELTARGFSRQQAEDVASGRVRVSTDQVTGAISLVNVATGDLKRLSGQSDIPKKTRSEMASQVQSIEGLLAKMPSLQKAIEKGVGFIPAAKEFGGKVLGQLPTGSVNIPGLGEIGTGEAAVNPEVVKARTQLRIFREDIIAAFRKSGRVPVQEQQRILQFVDKLGVLNSAPDAKLAFQQLEQELRRIRDTYDVQLRGQALGGRAQVKSGADYDALPSGTEFVAPDGSLRRKP